MNKFIKKITFSALAVAMLVTPLQVYGAGNDYEPETKTSEITYYMPESVDVINESSDEIYFNLKDNTLELDLPDTLEVLFFSPTDVHIVDAITGEIEVLPSQVISESGVPILLFYTQTDNGLSVELVPLARFWRCAGGIVAGTIGGGMSGANTGNNIKPGVGTVVGGVVGGIGGAIGGALAFC